VRIGRFAYSAIAGHLPPDVAHRIYSGGRTVVAGAVKPNGKAFFADDGYRVTGHWAYGSGITHSSWTLGGCVVHDANGPRKGPDGEPEVRQVLFPTSATEVIDTWRVSGLRGTGSHDYRVGDVFVSESYTIPFPPQAVAQGGGLYAVPLLSLLCLAIAAVPLGIARAAIDEVSVLATAKAPQGSRTLLRDKPIVQAAVARAEALLGSARCYLIATAGRLWDEAARGAVSMHQRAPFRLACAHAARASAEARDLMYDVAGGSAIYEAGHLARCFRDVHACTQHIATATSNFELVGRVLFGLDPDTPRI
jgi:alkylation response protein AidB-like acyl-CoA dehydrogenase